MNNIQLLAYSVKYEGEYSRIKLALMRNEPYEPILDSLKAFTVLDDCYPEGLKNLVEPPYVLFYKGNLELLKHKGISVVGSRLPKDYATRWTKSVVELLSQRYVIISGLARGIDALAHVCALKHNTTIAVLGCGIHRIYPIENKVLYHQIEEEGLILSEYPSETLPLKHRFPQRNRIVAALGKAVVVMQADHKSGSMITVREALDIGKEIHTIPYDLDAQEGQGCNLLIQQGANMILSLEDVLCI